MTSSLHHTYSDLVRSEEGVAGAVSVDARVMSQTTREESLRALSRPTANWREREEEVVYQDWLWTRLTRWFSLGFHARQVQGRPLRGAGEHNMTLEKVFVLQDDLSHLTLDVTWA